MLCETLVRGAYHLNIATTATAMAKHIDENEVAKIVSFLAGWQGPITWELIAERCLDVIKRKPSRQTLARDEQIAIAYNAAKDRHKAAAAAEEAGPVNITLEVALQRLDRTEAKLVIAEAMNAKLTERFVTWQYNAFKFGITKAQLEEPLPAVDLNRTDGKMRPLR